MVRQSHSIIPSFIEIGSLFGEDRHDETKRNFFETYPKKIFRDLVHI